jgi:hypothetical protein
VTRGTEGPHIRNLFEIPEPHSPLSGAMNFRPMICGRTTLAWPASKSLRAQFITKECPSADTGNVMQLSLDAELQIRH